MCLAGAMNLGDNPYWANLITWVLKNREPLLVVLKKRGSGRRMKEIGMWKGLPPPASHGFENRGEEPRTGGDFKSWNVLQPITSKSMQTVLHPLSLYNNPKEQLSGFSTRASTEDATTNTLILSVETHVELLTYMNLRW